MFYALSDRIAKLETGPNQPGYTADAAQATAVQATVLATQATTAANLANTQATTAIALAGTKNTVFYSGSAPTANAVNDQWINTAQGNKLYIWNGSSWVSVQDTAIAAAQSASVAAQTTANGKNAIYRQGTTPTTPYTGSTFLVGDMWFNTSADNAISTWNGTSWGSNALGNSALYGNISANKLTSGTIDASVINVSNINAGNISTGYLAAGRIQSGSLDASVITAGTITASQIATGTITATQIATGTITATEISSSYVYAGTISANNITTGTLSASVGLTAQTGTIGGFTIGSTYLSSGVNFYLNASTGDAKLNSVVIGNAGVYYLQSDGSLSASTVTTTGALSIGTSAFISSGGTVGGNFQVNSLGSVAYNSTGYNIGLFGTGLQGTVAGRMYKTTSVSSKRFKHNIEPFIQRDYLNIVSKLDPVTFNYNADIVDNPEITAYGLIAEDVQEIPETEELVNIGSDGLPESIAYDRLQWYVIKSISQLTDRLDKLEGK
jgi:hypothetical protein